MIAPKEYLLSPSASLPAQIREPNPGHYRYLVAIQLGCVTTTKDGATPVSDAKTQNSDMQPFIALSGPSLALAGFEVGRDFQVEIFDAEIHIRLI